MIIMIVIIIITLSHYCHHHHHHHVTKLGSDHSHLGRSISWHFWRRFSRFLA